MKNNRGFTDVPRQANTERDVEDRVHDWKEIVVAPPPDEVRAQASRCLDCGVPFCHASCPLGNLVPEWNDLVSDGAMDEALDWLCARLGTRGRSAARVSDDVLERKERSARLRS